jgi:SARP family transcriptional regulator, regulator of embCAB operon
LDIVLRIYLTGEPCILAGGTLIRAARLPRRQGRVAFAFLVGERWRAVPRAELADALWPDGPPAAHETALSALASKLRTLFVDVGIPRDAIGVADGCFRVELPASSWIDTEAAHAAVHEAEAALRSGRHAAAYGPAVVAAAILRRPFLPGIDGGDWVERRRDALRALLVRVLDVLAQVHAANREPALAIRVAEQVVSLEPFRESGYRRLMLLHDSAGDRGEALHVYRRCRRLLADELGTLPSPETEALMRTVGGR